MSKLFWFVLACAVVQTVGATTVQLHSGNGSIGGTDSLVTMEIGPPASDFGALTATDFTAAHTGPSAFIIAPHPAWDSSLVEDPAAQWIGTNPGAASSGNTALYAISFNLAAAPASPANLSVIFLVDNSLGSGTNQGIFLNGVGLVGSNGTGGSFGGETTYTDADVSALLTPGTNTLYIDAENGGGPAGLIFSATLSFATPSTGAPEPATLGTIAAALAGLAVSRRRIRGA